jgi:hypothetical protein
MLGQEFVAVELVREVRLGVDGKPLTALLLGRRHCHLGQGTFTSCFHHGALEGVPH